MRVGGRKTESRLFRRETSARLLLRTVVVVHPRRLHSRCRFGVWARERRAVHVRRQSEAIALGELRLRPSLVLPHVLKRKGLRPRTLQSRVGSSRRLERCLGEQLWRVGVRKALMGWVVVVHVSV